VIDARKTSRNKKQKRPSLQIIDRMKVLTRETKASNIETVSRK
jgi:hypothetical protein